MNHDDEERDSRSEQARSLMAFEEMLDFLVIRLSQASDAFVLPGDEGELTSALQELSNLMDGLVEEVVFESSAHRRALVRTALPAVAKAILARTYADEPEVVVRAVQNSLVSVTGALAKVLPATDGVELEGACEAFNILLDRRRPYYRHSGSAGAGASGADADGVDQLSVMSEEEWRAGVGFADWVDAVCADSQADLRRWGRAQIVEESSTGRLRLSFEGLSDYHDEWVDRDTANIAPPGTRSGQDVERWRQTLQRGSLVDALDPNNIWTNATVMATRERLGAPVVLGVGPMAGGSADRGLDLLIGYRVYDPHGDKEEVIPDGYGAGESGNAGDPVHGSSNASSPAARREELDAMAAAAAPGGLARRPQSPRGTAGIVGGETRDSNERDGGIINGGDAVGVSDADDTSASLHDRPIADGGFVNIAASGWGLAGETEGGEGVVNDGGDGGSSGDGASGRVRRYFGLAGRDEWIRASSTRIEKLNSHAPWKNSWAAECPVNDQADPYLTDDGKLMFAVARTPVDGAPTLVQVINAFGQEGGFENLIVRLSPVPAEEGTLPRSPPAGAARSDTQPVHSGNPSDASPGCDEEPADTPPRASSTLFLDTSATAVTTGEDKTVKSPGLVPVEAVRNALLAVASIRPLLARRVAKAVLDRTAAAVSAALKEATDAELRSLTRERLEEIMKAFREILKRAHRSSDAFEIVERLQLDLALKLYSCPFMERKLQGLKVLADAVAASVSISALQGTSPALTPQELVKWLDDNNFVRAIFSGHTQLIRRSGDILGFLCREKALSPRHLNIIWAAGGGGQDKDRRICVHEVLRPLLYQLDMELLELLADKLSVQPPDEVIEDTVTFIKDVAEAAQQGAAEPAVRLTDLLWTMADDNSPYRPRIKACAAESILLVTGLRGIKNHRAQTLERCLRNVRDGRAVVTSLKVMEAVLKHFPQEAMIYENVPRSVAIHKLEVENGLLELLLGELESYVLSYRRDGVPENLKASSCGTAAHPPPLSDSRRRRDSINGEDHLAQVKARLHTLEYVIDNSCLVLDTEHIKRLWACLGPTTPPEVVPTGIPRDGASALRSPVPRGEVGATPSEVSTLLSWLSKACEAWEGEGGGMFEPRVAVELFKGLIVSDGETPYFAASRASPEWFSCFQTFFFRVNSQAGRMCCSNATTIVSSADESATASATSTASTAATETSSGTALMVSGPTGATPVAIPSSDTTPTDMSIAGTSSPAGMPPSADTPPPPPPVTPGTSSPTTVAPGTVSSMTVTPGTVVGIGDDDDALSGGVVGLDADTATTVFQVTPTAPNVDEVVGPTMASERGETESGGGGQEAEGMIAATRSVRDAQLADTSLRDPEAPLDMRVVPSSLVGMRALWTVALEAENLVVVEQATRLLNRTHQELAPGLKGRIGEIREGYINTCMAYVRGGSPIGSDEIKDGDDHCNEGGGESRSLRKVGETSGPLANSQRSVVRALHLLEELVDETEMGGTAGLMSHGARVRGSKVSLRFDNKVHEATAMASTFSLEMHSNTEIWEVRRCVARLARMPIKTVALKLVKGVGGKNGTSSSSSGGYNHCGRERRSVEALDRDNSRRLADLRLRSDDVWVISRRREPAVPRAPLLDASGNLLPKPAAIFESWFRRFQNADGMMDRVGAANFIDSCCHDKCKPTDERVNKFFRNYDEDGDDLLKVDEFLCLFQDSCKDLPHVVWNNLRAHFYREDLTRASDDDQTAANNDLDGLRSADGNVGRDLPRSIISRDARSVDRLISVLSLGGPAATGAWRFLMRLPTNPEILEGVRTLKGFPVPKAGVLTAGDSDVSAEDSIKVVRDTHEGLPSESPGTAGSEGNDGPENRQDEPWTAFLGPPGSHRMLYTLQVVEGVLSLVNERDDKEVNAEALLPSGAAQAVGSRGEWEDLDGEQWVVEFVRRGVFRFFCDAVLTKGLFGDMDPENMVDTQQACLTLILKVVRIILEGVLSIPREGGGVATRGQSCTIPSRKIPQRTPGVTTTAVEAWTTPEEAGLFPREDTLSTTDTDVMDETVTIVTAAAAELRAREFEQEDSHRDAGTMIASETQASAIAEEQAITFPVAEIVSARVDDRNETGEHAAAAADATAETSSALSTIAVVMPAGSSGGSTMVDETAPPKGDVSGGEAKRLAAPPLPQRRQRSLWERLPRDVSDAVRKAARATELLARLMELTGTAADIADSNPIAAGDSCRQSASDQRSAVTAWATATSAAGVSNHSSPSPLDLFGCVGEGPPADSMAQEALQLWVALSRAPPEACADSTELQKGGGVDGETQGRDCRPEKLDGPVLKGILCASDAIRLQLAQSLLEVCGTPEDSRQNPTIEEIMAPKAKKMEEYKKEKLPDTDKDSSPQEDSSEVDEDPPVQKDPSPVEKKEGMAAAVEAGPDTADDGASAKGGADRAGLPSISGEDGAEGVSIGREDLTGAIGPQDVALRERESGVEEGAAVSDCPGAVNAKDSADGKSLACRSLGSGITAAVDPVVERSEALREHAVRLLLENLPRANEDIHEGDGAGNLPGKVPKKCPVVEGGCRTVRSRTRAEWRDCTQLFDVLCVLVKDSIEARHGGCDSRRHHRHDEDDHNEGGRCDSKPSLDVDGLASNIVQRLLAHPCRERRGARESEKDTLLVGLLKLGVTLVEACPEAAVPLSKGLVEALLSDFLFATPTPASTISESMAPTHPTCKTVASRAMAFKLIAALCKPNTKMGSSGGDRGQAVETAAGSFDPSQNLQLLLDEGLEPLRKLLPKPDVWGYSPSAGVRSAVGRVGLRNLGNTCYINSCLQQLFMIEPLRNGLLSLGEGDTDPGSLVGEVQKLFGHLALSEKQAVDPLPLLRTIKGLDGNPIDVSVQQDAHGFLLHLLDKMEAGLKNTPQSSLLMSTFEGKLITQLICPKADSGDITSSTHVSLPSPGGQVSLPPPGGDDKTVFPDADRFETREKWEAFMCVSLEVKDMLGVEEALEKYTEKETIEGYTWDEERKDTTIHKRTVLGNLPPNVVLHLNRFKMNLDTFQTEKVNTRFEFPSILNLEPFTKEGLAWRESVEAAGGRGCDDAKRFGLPGPYELHPREHYTYKLRGVVVHTGTANQGHYFSYIRDPSLNHDGSGNNARYSHVSSTGTLSSVTPPDLQQQEEEAFCSPLPSPAPHAHVTVGSPSTTSLSVDSGDGEEQTTNEEAGIGSGDGSMQSPADSRLECRDGVIGNGGNTGTGGDRGQGEETWCEFNDMIVKEWGISGREAVIEEGVRGGDEGSSGRSGGLEVDCFGGQQTTQETDEDGWPRTLKKDNIQNAYLLLYERFVEQAACEPEAEEEKAAPGCDDSGQEKAVPYSGITQSSSLQNLMAGGGDPKLESTRRADEDAVKMAVSSDVVRLDTAEAATGTLGDTAGTAGDVAGTVRDTAGTTGDVAADTAGLTLNTADATGDSMMVAMATTTDTAVDPASDGLGLAMQQAVRPSGDTTMSTAVDMAGAAVVPPAVFRSVWDENDKFLLDRHLYHVDMSTFVLEILTSVRHLARTAEVVTASAAGGNVLPKSPDSIAKPDKAAVTSADGGIRGSDSAGTEFVVMPKPPCAKGDLVEGFLDWGVKYALENLARAQDNEAFPLVIAQLQGLFDLRPNAAKEFLDREIGGGMQGVREMLLLCPDRPVRMAMKGFYLHLLGILAEEEGDRYLECEETSSPADTSPIPSTPPEAGAATISEIPGRGSGATVPLSEDADEISWCEDEQQTGRPCTRLGRMVVGWVGLLPDAARSWGRFEQFLEFMEGVSNMGDRERDLLLNRRMLCRLSSFFLQDKSPVLNPKKRLPKMGHKTAPPRFSPLVRCLKTLRAHSGETARWRPRGMGGPAGSDTDTASDSEGSRTDDSVSSTHAVVALPIPPFPTSDPGPATMAVLSPRTAPGSATSSLATIPTMATSEAKGVRFSGGVMTAGIGAGVGAEGDGGSRRGHGMSAKERAKSVELSSGCRRCLNCEALYDLALEEDHAAEEATELMCAWAADCSKRLRPLSRIIVRGVDTPPVANVDNWLMAMRRWLEVNDTLQVERLQLVLGTGQPEEDPKLLSLMVGQKDKYPKWFIRVLLTLSELMADNSVVGTYVSVLRTPDMLPWADWITKHLSDSHGSLRSVGPARVKEEDLVQIKENLRAYDNTYFGRSAEDRLLERVTRARIGPAEGEPGVTRVESSASNGVQLEMLDLSDVMPGETGGGISEGLAIGAWRRVWRVTNHRFDSVNFAFAIRPTTARSEMSYPSRWPNYHIPPGRGDVKLYLKSGVTAVVMEVDKLDLTKEFGPWPFSWQFDSAGIEPPPQSVATVPTASDILQQHAQLEGDIGEAARVALAAEREEAAEAEAAAVAAAEKAEEEEMAQAVAEAAASLPAIPFEVVSKMKADGSGRVDKKSAMDSGSQFNERLESVQRNDEDETAAFWDAPTTRGEEGRVSGGGVDASVPLVPQDGDFVGTLMHEDEEDDDTMTVLFNHKDSETTAMGEDGSRSDEAVARDDDHDDHEEGRRVYV